MKGFLINKDGTQFQLPELLSWDVCHGTGEPCDYFEVKTVYSNTLLPKLEEAVRFKGTSDEQTVFFGVVDEYQISIDERGSTVSINGRSLAAVLMDNEVQKHTYYSMTRDKVIEEYVSPYGISDIAETAMPQVLIFTVKDGDSAWSVLKRYCLKSLHSSPCFDPAGKLHMRKRTGKSLQINADEQAVSAKYKDERYGIISEISVINRSSGGSYTLKNQEFINRGGNCKRFLYTEKFETVISGSTNPDTSFTGRHQIESSMFGKKCVEITLPEQFPCFPDDTVSLSCNALAVNKSCRVIKTHCWADAVSAGTSITLEV